MPAIRFLPLPTAFARRVQGGGPDENGQPAERRISDGTGVPCRHCLRMVPAGAPYLICAHRPFSTLQPYAEVGPVFLCAHPCDAAVPVDAMPAILASPSYNMRGYGADERIVYGTGGVVARDSIAARAADLLDRAEVSFVHVRSAANTCFQLRIERA
jgi:hypothetical protein